MTSLNAAFVTTQWTRVLQARGDSAEAKVALSELCAAYYAPVFAFVRRNTPDEHMAQDLTHEFFERLLAGRALRADPERGRFRSYLLAAVKHFLADKRDFANAAKRGGGQTVVSLQHETETGPALDVPDATQLTPDAEFDRKWALTLLERALQSLQAEHSSSNEQQQFDVLKPFLMGDAAQSQAEAARQLGCSESAGKVQVHRLRKRFRELVKTEIRQTLNDPLQVSDELNCLFQALAR
jgi:RNA polymerase sigma factor (sigma-70 family)